MTNPANAADLRNASSLLGQHVPFLEARLPLALSALADEMDEIDAMAEKALQPKPINRDANLKDAAMFRRLADRLEAEAR